MIELPDLMACKMNFGKFYDNVDLHYLNKQSKACNYNGVDLIPCEPNDTICEFNYFRKLGDTNIREIDNGGCHPDYEHSDRFIWVYFNKENIKSSKITFKFKQLINSVGDISVQKIIDNKNDLYKKECSGLLNLEFKNCTYLAIEVVYTQLEILNNCQNDECI